MSQKVIFSLIFHLVLTSVYIYAYLEETSAYTEARYERYGFDGHKLLAVDMSRLLL